MSTFDFFEEISKRKNDLQDVQKFVLHGNHNINAHIIHPGYCPPNIEKKENILSIIVTNINGSMSQMDLFY